MILDYCSESHYSVNYSVLVPFAAYCLITTILSVPSYTITCYNCGHGTDMRGCPQSPFNLEGMCSNASTNRSHAVMSHAYQKEEKYFLYNNNNERKKATYKFCDQCLPGCHPIYNTYNCVSYFNMYMLLCYINQYPNYEISF